MAGESPTAVDTLTPPVVETSTAVIEDEKWKEEVLNTLVVQTKQEQEALKGTTTDELTALHSSIGKSQKKVDLKKNTEALRNLEYKKDVLHILGLDPTFNGDIKAEVRKLQAAVGLSGKNNVDGALGPKTFDKLKVEWDAFTKKSPDGKYQDFIDRLMKRQKTEQPAVTTPEQTNTPAPNEEKTVIKSNTVEVSLKNSVIEDKNRFGFRLFEDAKIVTNEERGEAVSLELDGAIIDRDAYRITESSDKKSYELNIRAMDDNVRVGKEDLKNALEKGTVTGKTINGNKEVDLIINKEKLTAKEKENHVSIGKETYAEIQATATYETSAAETTPIQSSILPITPTDIVVDTMLNSNLNAIGDKALNTPSNEMGDNPTTPTTEFTV